MEWIQPLKDIHSLTPGTCEQVTLHGVWDFADVIKLRILREGHWPTVIRESPGKREAGGSEWVEGGGNDRGKKL